MKLAIAIEKILQYHGRAKQYNKRVDICGHELNF